MRHTLMRLLGRYGPSLILAAFFATAGCGGPPQISSDNREIIVSLATAISSRSSEWLEANAALVEKRRSEGACGDEDYQAFSRIIAQARAGDWKSAEAAVYALRDAQQPTAADLENLARRKVGHDHTPTTTSRKTAPGR